MDANLLQSIPFLREVPLPDLDVLGSHFRCDTVPKGAVLVEEGRPMSAFSIVCRGLVHVRRRSGIREVLLARIEVGGFFGEVNLFSHGEATASIHAMLETEIASIPYPDFLAFMESHPAAGYRIVSSLMTELAQRLRETNSRLASNLFWQGKR